jgi:hypothetical protein
MKSTQLHESNGLRTFAVILGQGEEPMSTVTAFAVEHRLGGSHFTAIGAFSSAVVAYFDWSSKRYRHIPIEEQVEVLSMIGDITIRRDTPNVHAHIVLGKADASAHGGHLIRASVRPTLEIVITEAPHHLHRVFDAESGLALIDPSPIVTPSS